MSDTPRVWLAEPHEAEAVAGLLAAFRDHLGYGRPSDDSILASVWRLIERPDTEFLLGAAGDDAPPSGVVQLRFRWGVWWDAEDCWLEDLYVSDQARGSGLGRALVEAAFDRARLRDCRRVELDVNTENAAARALYESLGFTTGKTGGQDLFLRRHL